MAKVDTVLVSPFVFSHCQATLVSDQLWAAATFLLRDSVSESVRDTLYALHVVGAHT